MNRRVFTILPIVLALLLTIPAAQAQLSVGGIGMSVPVNLTFNNGTSGPGILTIKKFVRSEQQVLAIGTLAFTHGLTSYVRSVSVPLVLPTAAGTPGAQRSCEILNLTLGPLHLDLLGLVVDLNRVVLNITAESGPGNLLGNLLCAIVGLFDSPILNQLLDQLVNLLNILIGILG